MRAATALVSLLDHARSAAAPHGTQVWHAAEIADAAASDLPSGHAALDAELPGGGWPQAALTELLLDAGGLGELTLLAPTLARLTRAGRTCVWVLPPEDSGTRTAAALPYAPALAAANINTARCIFVRPATPREGLWALEQSLRAAHLGAVIGWLPAAGSTDTDFRALRRLHLLAASHRTPAFLLRSLRHVRAPSPAALRLSLASHDGLLDVTILKRRGLPLLDPICLQVLPAPWNHAQGGQPALPDADATTLVTAAQRPIAEPALPARRWSVEEMFSH
jgi:hypothetical protein